MPEPAITLHGTPLSGHAHRVELMLFMLGLPYGYRDATAAVRRTPEFLALNPLGQIPVLQDGALVFADSNAILVYLAKRYDRGGTWMPGDAEGAARVQRWLSIAAGELAHGPATARAATLWAMPGDPARAGEVAARLLCFMESHLAQRTYLAAGHPTVADLACYGYVAHAPEGGVALDPYPACVPGSGGWRRCPGSSRCPVPPQSRREPAMDDSPFHEGEREAQRRAGVEAHGGGIRDWMPDQHRAFFAGLPFVVTGTASGEGWPTATMLTGSPGFVSSSDARTLRIAALPDPADPAAPGFVTGAPVALLGIDLGNRRRNRANGRVAAVDAGGFTVGVEQSFGNCPQYIQAREVGRPDSGRAPSRTETLGGLDAEARALIGAADTFFVASSAGKRRGDEDGGSRRLAPWRPAGLHAGGRRRADDPRLPRQPLPQHAGQLPARPARRAAVRGLRPRRPAAPRGRGRGALGRRSGANSRASSGCGACGYPARGVGEARCRCAGLSGVSHRRRSAQEHETA